MSANHHSFELLEPRIAPALVFVSGTTAGSSALKVVDASGNDAQDAPNEIAAQAASGATKVIALAAGDQLVFDKNGNHTLDTGDVLMAQVDAGNALFFLTNGHAGKNAKAFELTELTGLAVSDGFSGTVDTDINGPVATVIDSSGNFKAPGGGTLDLQAANITSLTVKGQITGDVLAGGSISNLTVGGPLFNKGTPKVSIGGELAAGTAADSETIGFDGMAVAAQGATVFQVSAPTFSAGTAGASISHVLLSNGVSTILAGDGAANSSGSGGAGGSVTDLRIVASTTGLAIHAGHGGNTTTTSPGRAGGAGGDLQQITAVLSPSSKSMVELLAGDGGSAHASNDAAGRGGAVGEVTMTVKTAIKSFEIKGGTSGNGGFNATSGPGGQLIDLHLQLASIVGLIDETHGLMLQGGDGAGIAMGGTAGGAITNAFLKMGGAVPSTGVLIAAGHGGEGDISAGPGGSISQSSFSFVGKTTGITVQAGDGSVVGSFDVGVPGAIHDCTFYNAVNTGALNILGGSATQASAGGQVESLHITNTAANWSGLTITGGQTSAGSEVDDLSIVNSGRGMKQLAIAGGLGAGTGGAIAGIHLVNTGTILTGSIHGGNGTTVGGDLSGIFIDDIGAIGQAKSPLAIYAGGEDSANASGGAGASVGDLSDVHFNSPRGFFTLGIGSVAGDGVNSGNGGDGGAIHDISGTVGDLAIVAADAGNGGGFGGTGGSVSNIDLTAAKKFIRIIAAGNGGDGLTGGPGGSVSDVVVHGDIGDFTKTFGFGAGQQGGLSPGAGGVNGELGGNATAGAATNLTADRIASIVAGQPSAAGLSSTNAVSSLSGIFAAVIGADTHRKGVHHETSAVGTFDFNGGTDSVFDLGTDQPIDGLVLTVAATAADLSVTPLKLITLT